MRTHIQKLMVIADKLRERDQVLTEVQLVTRALSTIPESFRIVRSLWTNVPVEDRTLEHLLQRLLSEENVAKSYKKTDDAVEVTAFTSRAGARGGYTPGSGGYPGTRGRGGRGRPHGVRGGFVDKRSSQHVAQSQPQPARPERPFCDHCRRVGHIIDNCYQLNGYPGQNQTGRSAGAFVSCPDLDPRSIFAFFADSGASKHMSDQRQFFENFKEIEDRKWAVEGISDCPRSTSLIPLSLLTKI